MPQSSAICAMRTPFLWLRIPTGARLQRHRHRRRRARRGMQDARNQRLVLQQRGSREPVAHLLGRTAHVDVDDLGAGIDVAARGLGHHQRIETGDLHHARAGLAAMIHATSRFRRVPQPHVGAEHFRCGEAGAESAAQNAKRTIGDSRHGREHDIGAQDVRSDSDGHGFVCGAASSAHATLLIGTTQAHVDLESFGVLAGVQDIESRIDAFAGREHARGRLAQIFRRLEIAGADVDCRSGWRA